MPTKQQLMQLKEKTFRNIDTIVDESFYMLAQQGIDPKKFKGIAKEAILANPDIMNCDARTVARAIRRCCRDGIVPDGDMGAIVSFGGQAVAMHMVQGLKRMAHTYLEAEIRSGVVYEGDEVRVVQGVGIPPVVEVTAKDSEWFKKKDQGKVVGAYCLITLPFEDTPRLTIFREHDIERCKDTSRAKSGPWKTWPDRMAEKSCVKRAIMELRYMKNAKGAQDLFRAVMSDNEEEYGPQVIDGQATDLDPSPGIEAPPENETPKEPEKPKRARRKTAAKKKEDPPPPDPEPAAKTEPPAVDHPEAGAPIPGDPEDPGPSEPGDDEGGFLGDDDPGFGLDPSEGGEEDPTSL